MFFRTWVRNSGSITLAVVVIVINVVALRGAVRLGFIFYQLPAAAQVSQFSKGQLETQTNTVCPLNRSTNRDSNSSAAVAELFPVCILLSIGDDTGRADDAALPFPLLYRLFDAAKAEVSNLVKETSSSISAISDPNLPVKVLVGMDYASVACKMARDSFRDDVHSPAAGVELTCGTLDSVRNELVDFSGKKSAAEPMKVGCGTVMVGGSSRYISQMTLKWAQFIRWEDLRIIDLDEPDLSHRPPALPRELWRPTVVTTFSSNHFVLGCMLLRSLGKAGMEAAAINRYNISIVVFALEEFNSTLQGLLECLVRELNEKYKVPTEIRQFNFSQYPPWMRINQTKGYADGGTGEYAWKVIMIHSVLVERGFIIWSDAGCRYDMNGLISTLDYTRDNGFANSFTKFDVPTLTHPGMIKYFRYKVRYNPPTRNCDGSRVGLTLDKYESLARPWFDCSLTRQCIAPDGSDRDNHRQDQAALTLLADMSSSLCQGVSQDVYRHMDYVPPDYTRTLPTKCYQDPLQVIFSQP